MKKLLSLILVLALCAGLGAPALAAEDAPSFSDVKEGHYAYSAITWCASRGVLYGYGDGTFLPDDPVTRAGFCAMLARVFFPETLAAYEAEMEVDRPWYWPSLMALARNGILAGTWWSSEDNWWSADDSWHRTEDVWWRAGDSGNFRVGEYITRYEMALLLYNIMARNYESVSLSEREAVQQWVPDWDEVPERYAVSVSGVYAAGIITGRADRSFGGAGRMTRAQGCVVIHRLVEYLGVPVARV